MIHKRKAWPFIITLMGCSLSTVSCSQKMTAAGLLSVGTATNGSSSVPTTPIPTPPPTTQNCQSLGGKITPILKNAATTFATEPTTLIQAQATTILFSRDVNAGTGNQVSQGILNPGVSSHYYKMSVQSDCSVQFSGVQSTTLCLDAGSGAGTALSQQTCDASNINQRWILVANTDPTTTLPNYTLKTKDNRCISVQGQSTNAGTPLIMSACDGKFDQQYYLPGVAENVTQANFGTYFKPNTSLYQAPFYKSTTTPNINPYKDSSGNTVPWQILFPPNYDQADSSKTYPVVVYLHGSGQSGTDNNSSVLVNGAEIFSTPEMQQKFPAIVVVPQCPTGDFCWGIGMATTTSTALATHALMNYVITTYHGDPKRVYVSGLSIGGIGTWDFIGRWSDMFTAALPLSGASKADEAKTGWLADNVQTPSMYVGLPIWATHGGSDTTVGFHDDEGTVPEIDVLPGGKTMLSILACESSAAPANPCGHGAWSQIIQNPGTLDWLFSQTK